MQLINTKDPLTKVMTDLTKRENFNLVAACRKRLMTRRRIFAYSGRLVMAIEKRQKHLEMIDNPIQEMIGEAWARGALGVSCLYLEIASSQPVSPDFC